MAVETCPKCKADVTSRYCPQCGQKMHAYDEHDLLQWIVANRARNEKQDKPKQAAMWRAWEQWVRTKMEPPI